MMSRRRLSPAPHRMPSCCTISVRYPNPCDIRISVRYTYDIHAHGHRDIRARPCAYPPHTHRTWSTAHQPHVHRTSGFPDLWDTSLCKHFISDLFGTTPRIGIALAVSSTNLVVRRGCWGGRCHHFVSGFALSPERSPAQRRCRANGPASQGPSASFFDIHFTSKGRLAHVSNGSCWRCSLDEVPRSPSARDP